jgi:hypothetical protein
VLERIEVNPMLTTARAILVAAALNATAVAPTVWPRYTVQHVEGSSSLYARADRWTGTVEVTSWNSNTPADFNAVTRGPDHRWRLPAYGYSASVTRGG